MMDREGKSAKFEPGEPLTLSADTLMVQGTSSSVGKSVLVAGLCRLLRQDGYRVAPFKAQNMALNSFVTTAGGEIGRAQAAQAEAASIPPTIEMNPVLLKPQAEGGSQVIVRGRVWGTLSAADYYRHTPELLAVVRESLENLGENYDIIVIEGAGSPAEINLKEREIVNMRTARLARAPVLLAGDIDRGGVFAAFVGTLTLMTPAERAYFKGFIVNKFRGDLDLLKPGLEMLRARTGLPVLGVVPYFRDIRIPEEDSVYLEERRDVTGNTGLDAVVIKLPHISNYDDFDPLEGDGVNLRFVTRPEDLGAPHLILLPGTKSTANALAFLRRSGLAAALAARARAGTPVIGICGGYQILGRLVLDPEHVESDATEVAGLGLLEVVTEFAPQKATRQVSGTVRADRGMLQGMRGAHITGYEIHMGRTDAPVAAFNISTTPQGGADYGDGTLSADGWVMGSYLHGIFAAADFRHRLLHNLRLHAGLPTTAAGKASAPHDPYEQLAALLRQNLEIAQLYRIIREGISES